jgi:hypothetical protein
LRHSTSDFTTRATWTAPSLTPAAEKFSMGTVALRFDEEAAIARLPAIKAAPTAMPSMSNRRRELLSFIVCTSSV